MMTPADRPRISPEFLAVHKRARLLEAMAALSAEKGYEQTTIADLAGRAHLARKTMYELFGGKDAIFVAAVEAACDALRGRLEAACEAAEDPDPRECLRAALAEAMSFLSQNPDRAHLLLVEAPAALPASAAIYDREFVLLTERLRPAMPDSAPQAIEEALVGAAASILRRRLRNGEADRIGDLLPDLEGLFLAPWDELDP